MKYKILSIFTVLTTLICVGCSNSSNSEDKERIAQLEAQIAKLSSQSNQTQSNKNSSSYSFSESHSSNTRYTNSTDFEKQESRNPNNTIVGVYEFSDNVNTWVMEINSDETAIIYNKKNPNGEKAYGSWYKYKTMKCAHPSFSDKAPIVWFPSGEETMRYPYFNDEWIYYDSSAADAKNPNLRLPLKKIK